MASLDFEIDLKYVKHLKYPGCIKIGLCYKYLGWFVFEGSCLEYGKI